MVFTLPGADTLFLSLNFVIHLIGLHCLTEAPLSVTGNVGIEFEQLMR
tara:strand:+ start:3852 stop:3995 length:144 start_codon:yes stop_codon:yes gene_type:complete